MYIKPLLESVLAKPFQGLYYHPAGTKIAFNTPIHTKRMGSLLVIAPNPPHLFLDIAEKSIEMAANLERDIKASSKRTVFSNSIGQNSKLTVEQIKSKDPTAEVFIDVSSELVYNYIDSAIKVEIFLVMALESYCNMNIPSDIQYKREKKGGAIEVLNAPQVQRYCSIPVKLGIIADSKMMPSFKQQRFWSKITTLNTLRNDFIHLKNSAGFVKNEAKNYTNLFNADLPGDLDAVIQLMNYFTPGYIEKT